MKIKNKIKGAFGSIAGILLKENYVTPEDIKKARAYSRGRRGSIVDYLINEQLINKELLGQAMAEYYQVPFADLSQKQPSKKELLNIPEKIAKKYSVVFFSEEGNVVTIASDKPQQKDLAKILRDIFPGRKIIIAYAHGDDIQTAFVKYRKKLETRLAGILKKKEYFAPTFIDEILDDALACNASDIHFEPQNKELCIRFRIDGILHEIGRIPQKYYENILNRLKVQSRLRIDEHFSAQDGAFRYTKNKNTTDLRVSIAPGIDGEKIVLRVLSEYARSLSLEDLGLSSLNQELLISGIKKPFGMILAVGPTGSGKTTTLYSILKLLNTPEVNISTIEDPVEYKINGVTHIQVNPDTNLTFSRGLKSIVRQDPDIIMVGEIRDLETAEIAVNAALTGHLLLSSFHANDAAATIPRLLDMEVEPFLLASSLELILSQRLVRRICQHCRYSYSEKKTGLAKIFAVADNPFLDDKTTLYKGKGCGNCRHTGYKGRTAIFEFIQITPQMKELIVKSPSSSQIWQLALEQGARPLFADGMDKVKNGISTLEEIFRIADPPYNYKNTGYSESSGRKL